MAGPRWCLAALLRPQHSQSAPRSLPCSVHFLPKGNKPYPRAALPPAQALGPEPKASTKFFLAFNVPEQALSGSDEGQAAWEELQASQASAPVRQASTAVGWAPPPAAAVTCLPTDPAVVHPPGPRVCTPSFAAASTCLLTECIAMDPPDLCCGRACCSLSQPLLEDAAGQQVAGNQLVAVLRQLQGMLKR